MSKQFVMFNGVRMVAEWPDRILEAQLHPSCIIGGREFPRIRYGEESDDWGADREPCHDCSVVKGQLHVAGCDVEKCPKCRGQAITCDCLDE